MLSRLSFLLALLLALPLVAQAQLVVDIAGGGTGRIPVAIAPFEGENLMQRPFSEVIRADLERSGLFRLVETGPLPIAESTAPDLINWRQRGADALLHGSVLRGANGAFEVRFRLHDVVKQIPLAAVSSQIPAQKERAIAHRIADVVYEKLLGEPGIFSTSIAYVLKSGGTYRLMVSDADGANPIQVFNSPEPIISPAWSPDASQMAVVSFHSKKPVIYAIDLAKGGALRVVANYKGSNSAPAWSPNGRQLAVVLTKDGQSQIYIVNADGTGLRRLMQSPGIDTEPSFSPDGQWVYFTSDRGGSAQIYRVPVAGGDAQRVTFEGNYNVTARVSPDGRTLAYITRGPKGFQLASMDLESRQTLILTDSAKDETPSFSPNSRFILYTSVIGGRGMLAAITRDGRAKFRVDPVAGDAREPAWAPFNR